MKLKDRRKLVFSRKTGKSKSIQRDCVLRALVSCPPGQPLWLKDFVYKWAAESELGRPASLHPHYQLLRLSGTLAS